MVFPAFLDACVLFPQYLNDTLLTQASAGTFRPLWSHQVLEELGRALTENTRMTPDQVNHRLQRMRAAFPDAEVTGYEALIDGMTTTDPDDRHVLAAAVRSNVEVLVTANLSDFPDAATKPFDITVVSPDEFLLDQLDLYADSRNPFAVRTGDASAQPLLRPVSRSRRPVPAPRSRPSDSVLEAAQMFGVDPASLREKKRPRERGRPSSGVAPTQGSLAVELSRRFRLPPETARATAEPWAMLLMSTDELTLRRFWDAGFDHTHHRQVEQCLTEGIGPDDLDARVDGRRVGEHILSGGPIRYLAIRLRATRS